MNKIRDELKEHFPYKVLEVYGSEADDIIATLVKTVKLDNKNLILSSDKDFIQLHGLHVDQFSPVTKKILNGGDPLKFLREHIIKGDRSDGVPNILSADDTFITEKRQKPIRKTMLSELTEALDTWEPDKLFQLAKCPKDTWVRNWQRNETLIDLNKIPTDITKKINREFDEAKVGSRSNLLNYFIENKLTKLIDNLGDF